MLLELLFGNEEVLFAIGPLAMALIGMGKSELIDKPQAQKQKAYETARQATTGKFSPWTGLQPDYGAASRIEMPNSLDAAIKGAVIGQAFQGSGGGKAAGGAAAAPVAGTMPESEIPGMTASEQATASSWGFGGSAPAAQSGRKFSGLQQSNPFLGPQTAESQIFGQRAGYPTGGRFGGF